MSNHRFKKGDRVRVIHNPDWFKGYQEVLHDKEGTIVNEIHDYHIQYGVDFGCYIKGVFLHGLDGNIKTRTGRYFYGQELVLIESKQLDFIIDPRFEELYV